jgi:hypothetical protein
MHTLFPPKRRLAVTGKQIFTSQKIERFNLTVVQHTFSLCAHNLSLVYRVFLMYKMFHGTDVAYLLFRKSGG